MVGLGGVYASFPVNRLCKETYPHLPYANYLVLRHFHGEHAGLGPNMLGGSSAPLKSDGHSPERS